MGSSIDIAGLGIDITFNTRMNWCEGYPDGFPASTEGVLFWCSDFSPIRLAREHLELREQGLCLHIHMASTVEHIVLAETSQCGLMLPNKLLCSRDYNLAFQGIQKSDYSFSLYDGQQPYLLELQPPNNTLGVSIDSSVVLTFSEPIFLKEQSDLIGNLSLLDGQEGDYRLSWPLKVSHTAMHGSSLILQVGRLKPHRWYTLSVSAASITDLSGNMFVGIPDKVYKFQTTTVQLRGEIPGSSGVSWIAVVAII
eukprot:TRINITY_DN37416_c0_g1_i1.p1 TRINITY_DN37416_c0_g1~~TRINITY_DN37416_c0_g1_i1.p1  ORF type:complete len:253 (-),score=26.86 TRINITY_DN37416_c0_g1_i1:587-1345(-)